MSKELKLPLLSQETQPKERLFDFESSLAGFNIEDKTQPKLFKQLLEYCCGEDATASSINAFIEKFRNYIQSTGPAPQQYAEIYKHFSYVLFGAQHKVSSEDEELAKNRNYLLLLLLHGWGIYHSMHSWGSNRRDNPQLLEALQFISQVHHENKFSLDSLTENKKLTIASDYELFKISLLILECLKENHFSKPEQITNAFKIFFNSFTFFLNQYDQQKSIIILTEHKDDQDEKAKEFKFRVNEERAYISPKNIAVMLDSYLNLLNNPNRSFTQTIIEIIHFIQSREITFEKEDKQIIMVQWPPKFKSFLDSLGFFLLQKFPSQHKTIILKEVKKSDKAHDRTITTICDSTPFPIVLTLMIFDYLQYPSQNPKAQLNSVYSFFGLPLPLPPAEQYVAYPPIHQIMSDDDKQLTENQTQCGKIKSCCS